MERLSQTLSRYTINRIHSSRKPGSIETIVRVSGRTGLEPIGQSNPRRRVIMAAGERLAATDISTRTIRKVRNRLIPLLFLLYLVAYLDRINIGFAALTMNGDLAITSTQFGLLT